MTPEQSREQLARVEKIRREAETYITTLETSARQVEAMARCINSFEFWCNNFSYTFDPRDSVAPVKRFIMFDKQREIAREIIRCVRAGQNCVFDKSRDAGASWLMMNVIAWMWLFEDSFHALVGSRVEKLVDDYTIDSLFGKIDHILKWLPAWMLQGYKDKDRKKLNIEHPRGNLITGESANRNFGRGPRKNLVYMDEYAFWEFDREVWTSTTSTALCRVATSTPCGDFGQFASLRFSDDKITKLTLHWTDDPRKNFAWYLAECDKLKSNPAAIAQELDINYKASAGRVALPWMRKRHDEIVVPAVTPEDASNNGATFFMGLDYGTNNPSSLHVYRVKNSSRGIEICSVWEYYEPSDLRRIATAVKECPWFPLVEKIYADPSMWFYNQHDAYGQRGVTSLAFILRDIYHVYVSPGRRGDSYALEQLGRMVTDDKEVMFTISEACPNQIRELEGLRYQSQSDKMASRSNVPEKLVDKDNHSWDDLKYFINTFFNKPRDNLDEEIPEPVLGMEALQSELAQLRTRKLEAVGRPPRPRRRLFRYR